MLLFKYEGYSQANKPLKGSLEAISSKEARQKLRSEGLNITKLSQSKNNKTARLSGDSLVAFTIQFSQLINAGLPIFESLQALQEQYINEKQHSILVHLCDHIQNGHSLSQAMSFYPESFNTIYRSMIAAGESSGKMSLMLGRLSNFIQKRQRQKIQTVTAMIYPAVLASFTLIVVILLLTFVVPSIREVFEDRQINGYTAIVLKLSTFITSYWYIYLPIIFTVTVYSFYYFKKDAGKKFIDRIALKTPIIRKLTLLLSLAAYTRTVATLLQSGIGLIEASQLGRKVIQNQYISSIFSEAEIKIIKGSSLSKELKKNPLIPALMSRMIAIGEESGRLGNMLESIADIYEDDVDKNINRITALAQPVILIILGSIVGLVLLAVLLPFTDITSLAQ